MRKNGDISVPRWSVAWKRLPQKEEKTGSLAAMQNSSSKAQGVSAGSAAKGALHGKHGVPRTMH